MGTDQLHEETLAPEAAVPSQSNLSNPPTVDYRKCIDQVSVIIVMNEGHCCFPLLSMVASFNGGLVQWWPHYHSFK